MGVRNGLPDDEIAILYMVLLAIIDTIYCVLEFFIVCVNSANWGAISPKKKPLYIGAGRAYNAELVRRIQEISGQIVEKPAIFIPYMV